MRETRRHIRPVQIAQVAIALLAVLGVIFIFSLVIAFVAPGGRGAIVGAWLALLGVSFTAHAFEALSLVATIAVAWGTVQLWLATKALVRSTSVQHTIEGPFLTIILEAASDSTAPPKVPQRSAVSSIPEYSFAEEDAAEANLSSFIQGKSAEYVNLVIGNVASKPTGLAAAIRVTVVLRFGGTRRTERPYSVKPRTFEIPLLAAGSSVAARVFNIAGLGGYTIYIDSVEYRDILGRRRCAAQGVGTLNRQPPKDVELVPTLFRPLKGEFTNAVDN